MSQRRDDPKPPVCPCRRTCDAGRACGRLYRYPAARCPHPLRPRTDGPGPRRQRLCPHQRRPGWAAAAGGLHSRRTGQQPLSFLNATATAGERAVILCDQLDGGRSTILPIRPTGTCHASLPNSRRSAPVSECRAGTSSGRAGAARSRSNLPPPALPPTALHCHAVSVPISTIPYGAARNSPRPEHCGTTMAGRCSRHCRVREVRAGRALQAHAGCGPCRNERQSAGLSRHPAAVAGGARPRSRLT